MSERVLLIDDDPDVLRSIGQFLEATGAIVLQEATGASGVTAFDREYPDVVVLDLHLPDQSGMDVLEQLRERGAAVILLTGHGDVRTAVQAMQLGAENFLTKPVDMPHLTAAIARAAEKVRLRREVQMLRSRAPGAELEGGLGVSPQMRELERQVAMVAESERTTLLLTGESGTGKGRCARWIHAQSPRAAATFVDINCGGLTSTFLEDELFGHERGAFTDAKESKRGLFELADGGTLFLDEIGDLAPPLQPKLLTALESKRFRRLGGTREVAVDVRLVTATNQDLDELIRTKQFREDLYYRISVAVIHLPPVRERTREDQLHLLKRVLAELGTDVPGTPTDLSNDALNRLLRYRWPGNVREMRNVLERAMIMARGESKIEAQHLAAEIRRGTSSSRRSRPASLRETERIQIERVLAYHAGNRTRTARELGISRVTLLKKIKDYGIEI
ncbi:MAG TPA: sigma-54 dependent transcriptional regulator [Gemmatimonadales bacterium]